MGQTSNRTLRVCWLHDATDYEHGERRKTRDLHSNRHSCALIPFAESRPGTEQNLRPAPPARPCWGPGPGERHRVPGHSGDFQKTGKLSSVQYRTSLEGTIAACLRSTGRCKNLRDHLLSQTKESPLSGLAQQLTDAAEMKMLLRRATDTLAELCKLLEDYGPRWYTRPQQERAESTLRLLGKR